MIFAILFPAIVLALIAVDANSRSAALGALVAAAISLLVGVIVGQIGLPLFVVGVALIGVVLLLRQMHGLSQQDMAVVQAPAFRKSRLATSMFGAGLALLLGLHALGDDPAFSVLSNEVISSRFPVPLQIEGHFGKGFAGLMLLLMLAAMAGFQSNDARWRNWWQVPLLAAMVIVVAIVLFSLPPDPKFPDAGWRFLLSNLLLTCVAEEAFFRGWLYKYAKDAAERVLPYYPVPAAILITALLFAAVHRGPVDYLVMVFILGCACGWARHVTGSVSAAVATHGIVNGVQFFVLKYPFA